MRFFPGCLLLLAACVLSCSSDEEGDGTPSGSVDPPPPTDNLIDVAVWPRMVTAGLTDLPAASSDELCRRLSLDLLGVIPTPDERAARCDGKSPSEMVDAFLADPAFAEHEVAFWIVRLGEDPSASYAGYLLEADEIVRGLARGELGYDEFAARILAHPAVTLQREPRGFKSFDDGNGGYDQRDRTEIGAHAIRVFLGRAPVGDEAADLGNLFRVWKKTIDFTSIYFLWRAELDASLCDDRILGAEACTSRRFGAVVTVKPSLSQPMPYELYAYGVSVALQEELQKPGRLLATRGEFWDEAADFALARFTGWWRSSLDQTETDLPEVREALAGWFRESPRRDLRELYRAVLTSLLYRTTADADAELPLWARGPTKSMTAEQWLDSAARGLERDLGSCDPHSDEHPYAAMFFPPEFRDPDEVNPSFDYFLYGSMMGGCVGVRGATRDPGLKLLGTHDLVAEALCESPPVPPGRGVGDTADADVQRLIEFQTERLLGRRALPDEVDAAVQATRECRAGSACDLSRLANQFCAALLRSATYFYY